MACVKFLLLALAYMCSNEVKQRCVFILLYLSCNTLNITLFLCLRPAAEQPFKPLFHPRLIHDFFSAFCVGHKA